MRTVKTLQSKFEAQEGGEKKLSFDGLTAKVCQWIRFWSRLPPLLGYRLWLNFGYRSQAKRTDAVKLFFELLVLKTRDMVHVEQEEAYGDIKITPRVGSLKLRC